MQPIRIADGPRGRNQKDAVCRDERHQQNPSRPVFSSPNRKPEEWEEYCEYDCRNVCSQPHFGRPRGAQVQYRWIGRRQKWNSNQGQDEGAQPEPNKTANVSRHAGFPSLTEVLAACYPVRKSMPTVGREACTNSNIIHPKMPPRPFISTASRRSGPDARWAASPGSSPRNEGASGGLPPPAWCTPGAVLI